MEKKCSPPTAEKNSPIQRNEEIDWREMVKMVHRDGRPALVKLSRTDDVTIHKDFHVDALLRVNNVTIEKMKIKLNKTRSDSNCATSSEDYITVPVSFGGKFQLCPLYGPSHVFSTVGEIIDVHPFIGDFIYPLQSIQLEDVKVLEYELLHVIRPLQDIQSGNVLEVDIVRRKHRILLHSSLEASFMQWDDAYRMKEIDLARMENPKDYSMVNLSEIVSNYNEPITVKLYEKKIPIKETAAECVSKKKIGLPLAKSISSKLLQISKKQTKSSMPVLHQPNSEEIPCENEKLFPESWWGKTLTVHPIYNAITANEVTKAEFKLSSELDAKVVVLSEYYKPRRKTSSTTRSSDISQWNESSIKDGSAISLNDFDLSRLTTNKTDAIVAVIADNMQKDSLNQSSLPPGTWIAIHRCHTARKLVFVSDDAQRQHYLVSPKYSGIFLREENQYANHVSVQFSTQELFQQSPTGPFRVYLRKPDAKCEFDPLASKSAYFVTEYVTESTVVVEVLERSCGSVKGSGTLLEVPASRSCLFLHEVPARRHNGIQPYPRRKDFNGLEKLPLVELISEKDINFLQPLSDKENFSSKQEYLSLCDDVSTTVTQQSRPRSYAQSLLQDYDIPRKACPENAYDTTERIGDNSSDQHLYECIGSFKNRKKLNQNEDTDPNEEEMTYTLATEITLPVQACLVCNLASYKPKPKPRKKVNGISD